MASELETLQTVLLDAAKTFLGKDEQYAHLFERLSRDVARAEQEPLTIFPVAHHSPASALHMVKQLQSRPPRVIFMELCEDLMVRVPDLRDCTLPVALQAFASDLDGFPKDQAPLSLVAPLTEMSAEYQAIAYSQLHPETELVFVDRSSDHVFQWSPQQALPEDDIYDEEATRYHGGAQAVRVGQIVPNFGHFVEHLVQASRVSHFEEWWNLYVDEPTIAASSDTYRRVFFLVGSLFRQLSSDRASLKSDQDRERFMWTRMKTWLNTHKVLPEDALYICGAAHTASEVEEFGTRSEAVWDIPPRTPTQWSYGIIPTSHTAIEWQFSQTSGAISVAEGTWKKALDTWKLSSFRLEPSKKSNSKKASKKTSTRKKSSNSPELSIQQVLLESPIPSLQDDNQLLTWCTRIVNLARGARYMASTADAIAIYEHAILLGRLRGRQKVSPWDFMDAAETCLEKDRVPGRKNIQQLCAKLMGGDRVGQVGYASLPPLVQDIYDRLEGVGVSAKSRNTKRVLLDLKKDPHLAAVSDLLWRLNAMLPHSRVARPIIGQRALGERSQQESWDIRLHGPEQREVIQLAFEGSIIEQVLERRLLERAFAPEASEADALQCTETCLTLLNAPRTAETLGLQAVQRLNHPQSEHAPEILRRARRLIHYYRTQPQGMVPWLEALVSTGYQSYCALLPKGLADPGARPESVAAALGFVLTLESLALTMGCSRSQLLIALEQGRTAASAPEKRGLLWAALYLTHQMSEDEIQAQFTAILNNGLSRDAYPRYLAGFLTSLSFTGDTAELGIRLLGQAFEALPDTILIPWFPGLLARLQPYIQESLPTLLASFKAHQPYSMTQLANWTPPWLQTDLSSEVAPSAASTPALEIDAAGEVASQLMGVWSESARAWSAGLKLSTDPSSSSPSAKLGASPQLKLLQSYPAAAQKWGALLKP